VSREGTIAPDLNSCESQPAQRSEQERLALGSNPSQRISADANRRAKRVALRDEIVPSGFESYRSRAANGVSEHVRFRFNIPASAFRDSTNGERCETRRASKTNGEVACQ